MSEERMIRVVMEDEEIVLGFLTIADKWGHTRVVDIEIEPVAPKDWVPSCFQADGCPEAVDDWTRGVGYPNCPSCPYRKKRE